MLNNNPTTMIPAPTTPTKKRIKGNFKTLFRMIVSESDRPMTDIMKASAVPYEAPFSSRAWTMGMLPASCLTGGP